MRRTIPNRFALFILLLAFLAMPVKSVMAHGGEDHGEKKTTVAPAGEGMTARVVRVGDFEVTIKHPNVEPGQEALARVFVTRFATNEPIGDAKINVVVDDAATGGPVEVAAVPTTTPGIYEAKLPPMAQGECNISARVIIGGESMVADYGAMQVMIAPAEASAGIALWARTALIFLAILIALGVIGVTGFFGFRHFRRNRLGEQSATAA